MQGNPVSAAALHQFPSRCDFIVSYRGRLCDKCTREFDGSTAPHPAANSGGHRAIHDADGTPAQRLCHPGQRL